MAAVHGPDTRTRSIIGQVTVEVQVIDKPRWVATAQLRKALQARLDYGSIDTRSWRDGGTVDRREAGMASIDNVCADDGV
jgi:hypothetical protein